MDILKHTAAVLCTADDRQAEAIAAALPWLRLIRCPDGESVREACHSQDARLVLIVDEPPRIDGCRLFGELGAQHPGLAGVLLSATADTALLHCALEAGFSGVVELPVKVPQVNRVVHQALERYRLQQENTRLRTLLPLYRMGEQLAATTSEEDILERLLDAVQLQTKASRCSLMLYDQKEQCLRVASVRGQYPAPVQSLRLQPGDQIAGWVFQQGKPVLLNRESQDESIFSPLLRQPETVSSISFPLRICEQNLGVLNISQQETEERFSEADNEMLSILCSQAAVALENQRVRQQLTETIRMQTLFEQYVAPEVAELLMAKNADLMELGEVKPTTVLFADIRNFTRLVQQIDLWSLRSFLNEFFHFFTDEVFRHRGTVDKFMGDAVLAVFGAPIKLDAPCLAAARTAAAIKTRFTELREQWGRRHRAFLGVDLGIAVTKGTVFLGNIGSNRRLDYTVIGNEVNIAQRLAAEASFCRIYITEAVLSEVGDSFEVEELGEIELRGFTHKPRIFSLLNGKERQS
ncbi:MAG: GAF domain-containing protein [Proteobacteria bacterium]|nr:GAF domain-containing protein [Pseudomonadota bacterium]